MQRLLDMKKKDIIQDDSLMPEENTGMEDLGGKVEKATKTMEFEEKKVQIAIQRQEGDISNMDHQVEIAALKLREREQELRLSELKIKELKRQTRHTALKPLEYEPQNSQVKTTGYKSSRVLNQDSGVGRSENTNLQEILLQQEIAELTEENVKLHEENMDDIKQGDEDYEFYSGV
mmetsp:Transcript_29482/g.26058  ORF Transcript_29482/g.26058 Transcript_29482/m.26058 type:complete len:176 (+) Transcript_29482:569-1096(+)